MFKLRINNYALEVWETNKAHERGFCKWRISFKHDDGLWEVASSSGNRWMTVDVALRECFDRYFTHTADLPLYKDTGHHHYWHVKDVTVNLDATQYVVQLECHCGEAKTVAFVKIL